MGQARRTAHEAASLDLASLGLDATASAVYEELLRSPDAEPRALADRVHLPCASVDVALSQLVQAGLARPSERPLRVEALRPEAALAQQISLKQRDAAEHVSRLSELREEIPDLDRLWRRSHRGEVETREFEIVNGVEQANARLDALLQNSRSVRSADQHRNIFRGFDAEQDNRLQTWLARGGDAQWIDEVAFATESGWLEQMETLTSLGLKPRLLATVPLQFRIYDDSVAVVPLNPSRTDAGIVLCRSEGVVAALLQLFGELWQRSIDWKSIGRPTESTGPAGVDARLPHLLASGSCDDSIARVMRVSARTVRRQVALLMSDLGVQSRLQLGVAMERRGLLARPPGRFEAG